MSRNIGVFVDISDLYGQIQHVYKYRKLDYAKYLAFIRDLGHVQTAIAYGCQKHNEAEGFMHCLEEIGFQTKFKRPKVSTQRVRRADWDVTIAVDVFNASENLDIIILGSTNKSLIPLIEWARACGLMVILIACNVGRHIELAASRTIEIPESLLEC